MKVAIDCNVFTTQKYGGISRYLVRLGEELSLLGNDVMVHGFLHMNQYLHDSRFCLTRMKYIKSFPKFTRRLCHAVGDLITEIDFYRDTPDIFHESYCHRRSVGSSKLPRICTIHDLIHELYPQSWSNMDKTAEFRRKTIARADAIICVSENTRRDLIRLTDVNPDKTHVVHHGYEFATDLTELTSHESKQIETAALHPFLLYVGNRKGYKNFKGLLEGLSRARSCADIRIIAFGGGSFSSKEIDLMTSLDLTTNNVIQISGSDTLLKSLYRHALALVYPSYYEGFGLPPLEAMSESCPVLASNSSCIPEIVGDAALYFEPNDFTAIANAIDSILNDNSLRSNLINLGHERVQHFSWRKCALETQSVYKKLLVEH